jgi:hypothetical protein
LTLDKREIQMIDVYRLFGVMLKALRREDKYLLDRVYKERNRIPSLPEVGGIFNLDEKHIQYILYKSLLELDGYWFFIEDPYKEKDKRYCDLTVYKKGKNWDKSLWIEIKTTGWCYEGNYKNWISSDAEKLRTLQNKKAQKYLLVTSIEDGKQDKKEWEDWFNKKEFQKIRFDRNLFGSFLSSRFKYNGRIVEGYYAVCLLQVI